MNRKVIYLLGFAAAVGLGHVGTILGAPRAIMHVAIQKMSDGGKQVNQFTFGPRTTSHSRGVVRPSPDLLYSSCVYDVSRGPIRVSAAPSPDNGYVSLSVFDTRTDNVAVFDSNQFPQGIAFVLAKAGQKVPEGMPVVISPSDRGVILDRRLAPSAELFAKVDPARRADSCAPL